MLVHCLRLRADDLDHQLDRVRAPEDPQKDFGLVRSGGTIGWILAAWPFTFILVDWAKVNAAAPVGFVTGLGPSLAPG